MISSLQSRFNKIVRYIFKNKFFLIFVSSNFFLAISIFYILVLNTQLNPIQYYSVVKKEDLNKFFPQGWAFFTRSSREAQIILYKIESSGKFKSNDFKHTSLSNYLGLNRKSTRIFNEISGLYEKIDKNSYSNIRWNYQSNSKKTLNDIEKYCINEIKLETIFSNSKLKGKFLIIFQEPIPFAFAKVKEMNMPAKAIIVNFI